MMLPTGHTIKQRSYFKLYMFKKKRKMESRSDTEDPLNLIGVDSSCRRQSDA